MRSEDAVARTNAFLDSARGASLDGDYASRQVAERVVTVQERAEALLRSRAYPRFPGLYVSLSKNNSSEYTEAAAVLPGYLVLVNSTLVEPGPSHFYPAVVSEDGLKSQTQTLRLHVLRQPYKQRIAQAASTILSAAGQSETAGVGQHGRKTHDGVEAEHFATLLAAGSNIDVQTAWKAGDHINHAWRGRTDNSVTAEVSKRLFGDTIPQTTLSISRQQIENGQAMLFWHEGMRNPDTDRPETATREKALVVIQGLGYEALQDRGPAAIDNLKRMLA